MNIIITCQHPWGANWAPLGVFPQHSKTVPPEGVLGEHPKFNSVCCPTSFTASTLAISTECTPEKGKGWKKSNAKVLPSYLLNGHYTQFVFAAQKFFWSSCISYWTCRTYIYNPVAECIYCHCEQSSKYISYFVYCIHSYSLHTCLSHQRTRYYVQTKTKLVL